MIPKHCTIYFIAKSGKLIRVRWWEWRNRPCFHRTVELPLAERWNK